MDSAKSLDASRWDFKIWKPKNLSDGNFQVRIQFCLAVLCHLAALGDHEVSEEENLTIAKIQLRRSELAVSKAIPLKDGIKQLCDVMLNGGTFWTASFLNAIMARGPSETDQLISEMSTRQKPYMSPTALVFGVAVLVGKTETDIFHFFQLLYNKPMAIVDEVSDTIKESLSVARRMFDMVCMLRASTSPGTATDQILEEVKATHEVDLCAFAHSCDIVEKIYELMKSLTDPLTPKAAPAAFNFQSTDKEFGLFCKGWQYSMCSANCDMMTAAAKLFSSNKGLCKVALEQGLRMTIAAPAAANSAPSTLTFSSAVSLTHAATGRVVFCEVRGLVTVYFDELHKVEFDRLKADYERVFLEVNGSWARLFNASIRGGLFPQVALNAPLVPEDEAL
ncbi:unnamed protein product [Clonostachys rosea]|uniref:Uncharacterized protein n=1 Tax=Bionectria ochroleuca TaxID=29856 RepID=A0ABY6TSD7_BIOOC|nr:unnamed protein product [Clonostachys rosea]